MKPITIDRDQRIEHCKYADLLLHLLSEVIYSENTTSRYLTNCRFFH